MKIKNCKTSLFTFIIVFISLTIHAQLKINSLFSDHMVLQQGVQIPVWGTTTDQEKITVKFDGQEITTVPHNGKWSVRLNSLKASSNPRSLLISTEKSSLEIKDILVGEVWFCSGQSNMERQLGPRPPQPPITNWEKERDEANYPQIREYYVPLNYSEKIVDDVQSNWEVCSPNTVSKFSAVGYFFAKHLHNDLKVPVGIIFSAFGGTPAEDWTSASAMNENPELKELLQNYSKVMGKGYRPRGQKPNGLYNGMVHPFLQFPIKGVAWYQGESNVDRAEQYETVLQTMIENWREDFHQKNLPFLVVQIAPHKDIKPEIREAQFNVSQKLNNIALIVTTDLGLPNQIHPPNKQPIGERFALAARGMVYGEDINYKGPVLDHYKVKTNKIVLYFSEIGKSLKTSVSTKLKGFEVIYANGEKEVANTILKKNKIEIFLNPNLQPVEIKYGWANIPDVNLVNSFGLPASPFRIQLNKSK